MDPVCVLQFTIGGPEFTGIASFLYQYYKKIDQTRVHFDFVFCRQNSLKMVSDDPVFRDSDFIELGAVTRRNQISYPALASGLEKIFRSRHYDVFHINTYRPGIAALCAAVARKCRVKTVIVHSHNARFIMPGQQRRRILVNSAKKACGAYLRKHCSYMFACSESAGEALFGRRGVGQDNFRVIKNAIDSSLYRFDPAARQQIREREKTGEDELVLGIVGRLSLQKNQIFGIKVLEEILKKRKNVSLWLIGTGPDEAGLREAADRGNIADRVLFFGQRTDVARLMQAMDALLLPSTSEGLGIVAIEAQAAGLPVYASDGVPEETRITNLIHYYPLADGPDKWAGRILQDLPEQERTDTYEKILKSGYDISSEAKALESFYVGLADGDR